MALESKVIFVDETNITFAFQNSQILVSHFISMDENSYNNIFAQSDARSIETQTPDAAVTRRDFPMFQSIKIKPVYVCERKCQKKRIRLYVYTK